MLNELVAMSSTLLPTQASFAECCTLLHSFIVRRTEIIERLEALANGQKLTPDFQSDLHWLSQGVKDCFITLPRLAPGQALLCDQLAEARTRQGLRPRNNPGNEIIEPGSLLLRAFHLWRQTRWPGQRGRVRLAHLLFNAFILRYLALLTLRLWDDEAGSASEKLASAQAVLDALWQSSPPELPRLVRSVHWLLPVAMSPTTDALHGYFEVSAQIADTLPAVDQLEIQRASVVTGAGHLRSQLRHLAAREGAAVNAPHLVLLTRVSNALDVSLLMEGLVMLLAAYERSLEGGDTAARLSLASAICQGLSPDPQLYVNRLDLLGPYTMIEHLFISTTAEGEARYTAMGERHLRLLGEYKQLITRLAPALLDDCRQFQPSPEGYSPYGVLFGFASNLLELMALKAVQLDAETRFCMEDAFTDGNRDKRLWVSGWRNLPHIKPEIVQQFDYPEDFAQAMHAQVQQALQQRVEGAQPDNRVGRVLFSAPASVDRLPLRYIVASDPALIAEAKAEAKAEADLLYCRLEGEFVVSYQSGEHWVGIFKDFLTELTGEGKDVCIEGLPASAQSVLRLMCPELVA